MTRPEITAEIKAQKELIDVYAAQVDAVIAASIERDNARSVANRADCAMANLCTELAGTMKKLGMTSGNVKRFVTKDALYHIEQELLRK